MNHTFVHFMPIGVPRVAFRLPGESVPQWVDLYNRLYRERVLFLGSALDDELANQLCGIMLYLNQENASRGIFMYINSPGGAITSGLSVADIMNYVYADLTTIGMGSCASMATFCLATGKKGQRVALENSRVMIHQPQAGMNGQAAEVEDEKTELVRLRRLVCLMYVHLTTSKLNEIEHDLDRDTFMDCWDTLEYGLVDAVSIGKGQLAFEKPKDKRSFRRV